MKWRDARKAEMEAETLKRIERNREQLRVGRRVIGAEDVDVPLDVLA